MRRPISFSAKQIAEIQECGDIGRPELNRAFKVFDGLVFLTLLRGHHAKIVPGFSIVGAQIHRLFEIATRLCKRVSSQVECPQVVVGDGVVGFRENNLFEFFRGLFEIAALKHRYAIGEIVALEFVLKQQAFHGKSFQEKSGRSIGNRAEVFEQTCGLDCALVNLDDHAVAVQEERRWERKISAAIEQVAVDDVVDAGYLRRCQKDGQGNPLFGGKGANCRRVLGIVEIETQNVKIVRRVFRLMLLEKL